MTVRFTTATFTTARFTWTRSAAVLIATAAALTATTVARSQAQSPAWPTKPVTLVVPFAAGSASDTVGRIMTARLSELLGQPVVVENIGGAGGTIGSARAAKAPADGSQFVMGGVDTFAMSTALYSKLPYDPVADFDPVGLVVEQPIILLARKSLPADDLKSLIAYGKSNKGELKYGSAGVGSGSHLSCAQLASEAGIDAVHVPFRGSAQVMQEIIAGRLDMICALGAAALPQITSGTLKPIAILTRERSPILPDLASAHEQGLADFNAYFWSGFFFPKGAPAQAIERLHAATVEMLDTPQVQERLRTIGVTAVSPKQRSTAHLQTFLDDEIERWGKTIKASGIKLD